MTADERFSRVIAYFEQNSPNPVSELVFNNDYQLLVAVMLSAQCTDKRINSVTPAFFERYSNLDELSKAGTADVLSLIKTVSYPNSKAAHLIAAARKAVTDFGARVPGTVEELMTLPGVGRKTANVVASIMHEAPVIAVDTHVFRVSRRLGLSKGKTPEAVETDLERRIPESIRPKAHHWLLLHGRYVCKALNPECGQCALSNCCLSFKRRSSASSPRAPK